MLGPAAGGCVKLSPDDDVTMGLGIAEGIETALSVMATGWSPVWATLSASTMANFPVLLGIEALTLFADNDASGTGWAAATACADRWLAGGLECSVWTPPNRGDDFNDILGRTA